MTPGIARCFGEVDRFIAIADMSLKDINLLLSTSSIKS